MFPGGSNGLRLTDFSRREFLSIGSLGLLGLSLPQVLRADSSPKASRHFGKAKSCLIIFLAGGPPQHETFDPKPGAPVEYRGDFNAIRTKVPGMHFCELLPQTAQISDKLTVIRSMATDVHSHSAGGHWMLTGYVHPNSQLEIPAGADDWPSLASVVAHLKPSERSPISSAVLPEPLVNNPSIPWPGQFGGFMGPTWNPLLLKCDPASEPFQIDGLTSISGVSELRVSERMSLLKQLDSHFLSASRSQDLSAFDRVQQQAFELVRSTSTRAAFELDRLSAAERDRYGRHKFGQSVLLARRLLEAGVRLVQVNWPREPGDSTKPNPIWDTHQDNAGRLKNVLCPTFDQPFSALIGDLAATGLLDETLVVVMGEFGRSPKINPSGGRDHWGSCFSIAVAGAGIPGGQIVGASDSIGAFPTSRPLKPQDLSATMFHLLGIDPASEIIDTLQRPRPIVMEGSVIPELLG